MYTNLIVLNWYYYFLGETLYEFCAFSFDLHEDLLNNIYAVLHLSRHSWFAELTTSPAVKSIHPVIVIMEDNSAIFLLTRESNVVTHADVIEILFLTVNSRNTRTCFADLFIISQPVFVDVFYLRAFHCTKVLLWWNYAAIRHVKCRCGGGTCHSSSNVKGCAQHGRQTLLSDDWHIEQSHVYLSILRVSY